MSEAKGTGLFQKPGNSEIRHHEEDVNIHLSRWPFFTFSYCKLRLQTVHCWCGVMKSYVSCTGFWSEDDALRRQEEQPEEQPEPSLPSYQPG